MEPGCEGESTRAGKDPEATGGTGGPDSVALAPREEGSPPGKPVGREIAARVVTFLALGITGGGLVLIPLLGGLTYAFTNLVAMTGGHISRFGGLLTSGALFVAAMTSVFVAFLAIGMVAALDSRVPLEAAGKEDGTVELPVRGARLLEGVVVAGFGNLLLMPLLGFMDLVFRWVPPWPEATATLIGAVTLLFFGLGISGILDEPLAPRILPDSVLRIGQVLRVRSVRCPYCGGRIDPEEEAVACKQCETLHHRECWLESNACTIFGCGCRHAKEVGPPAELPVPTQDGQN